MLFLGDGDVHDPATVFDRLRWGGQVIYVSKSRRRVTEAATAFETWKREDWPREGQGAWAVEERKGVERRYLWGMRPLVWWGGAHLMVARKVMLVPPGQTSERFTYHVYLEKGEDGYHVVKEVPSEDRVLARLKEKFPDADDETLRRRARKFTEKIFPVFLTRETAVLKLLQRDLPVRFRNRVPCLIAADTDELGYTRRLRMNWLRNARAPLNGHAGDGGRAITQLEFARQAAELLAALHDDARVMHLDLRLDNFVITDHGVGFVDFGSAVRVGEEFPESSLLSSLFDEMMRTSQIQRMLGKMTESGQVTSELIRNSYQRIDKAMDFFYLAVQFNAPHANPDFRDLVVFDREGAEAKALSQLTAEILRPMDGRNGRYASAREILRGIEEIERRLKSEGVL
jgi:hypothetical protein